MKSYTHLEKQQIRQKFQSEYAALESDLVKLCGGRDEARKRLLAFVGALANYCALRKWIDEQTKL